MNASCDEMVAVVCHDRPSLRTAVVRLLEVCGYEVRAATESFDECAGIALAQRACVVVVALPLTGVRGLTAVKALREDAPDCELVLMSPATALERAAIEAGARALVPEDDLRVLRTVLQEIALAARVRVPQARDQSDGVVEAPAGTLSTNPSS